MIVCSICGKEYKNRPGIHCHLLRVHYDEYKEAGFSLSKLSTGEPELFTKQEMKAKTAARKFNLDKQKKIRFLNLDDPAEKRAYQMGFRYIDEEEICYTSEELRNEGLL